MVDEAPKRGRKRLHADDDELRMLLVGAMAVLQRNGWAAASITDILDEAGLSRRAFYRHFGSKDELLLAVCEREVETVVRNLRARIDEAPDAVGALRAYVGELLSMRYDPTKADRERAVSSEGAQRAAGYQALVRRANVMFAEPLAELLRASTEAGTFKSADPEHDAMTVVFLIHSCSGGRQIRTWEAAMAHVFRFISGALGVPALEAVPSSVRGRRAASR